MAIIPRMVRKFWSHELKLIQILHVVIDSKNYALNVGCSISFIWLRRLLGLVRLLLCVCELKFYVQITNEQTRLPNSRLWLPNDKIIKLFFQISFLDSIARSSVSNFSSILLQSTVFTVGLLFDFFSVWLTLVPPLSSWLWSGVLLFILGIFSMTDNMWIHKCYQMEDRYMWGIYEDKVQGKELQPFPLL